MFPVRETLMAAATMAVLTTGAADAQELRYSHGKGVNDGSGWRAPTIEDAVTLLFGNPGESWPIIAILTQEDAPRPVAELDALAERLADSIIADTTREGRIRRAASWALFEAAMDGHRASFDANGRIQAPRSTA